MLELIRKSQVPSNLMHSASRGSLSVPPAEMIEILVHLAQHNRIFGQQARLTLAGWDEKASLAAAGDPATSTEVLGYFMASENLRPHLVSALAENPSVTVLALAELAGQCSRSVVEQLMTSPRVMSSILILKALQSNPNLRPNELAEIKGKIEALAKFLKDNEAELAKEPEKVFQAVALSLEDVSGDGHAESAPAAQEPGAVTNAATTVPSAATAAGHGAASSGAAHVAQAKKHVQSEEGRRDSTLAKIAKLDIKGRIALAMRGGKEERSILISDGTKLVALAVLDSPKISDGEVEKIALQKNVLEAVLRQIPLKRRFAKNYSIMRNLVFNPRTPLDLSLGLMKNLLIHDLRNLSGNKEVSETIRKLALRMFKQKMEKKD
jgi:hypothetical protein